MARKVKFLPKLVLFLIAVLAVTAWAEIKLRIYLQDGTLQAGNLITETPETFVILTKEGRSEIQKEKIMFINGKTLKQWQERPDKFFSTEIIPSELPNPAYVNDKASLPPVPPVSNVKPVVQPVQKPLAEVVPAAKPVSEKPASAAAAKPAPAAAASPATPAAASASVTTPTDKGAGAAVTSAAAAPVKPVPSTPAVTAAGSPAESVAAVPSTRQKRSRKRQPQVAPPVETAQEKPAAQPVAQATSQPSSKPAPVEPAAPVKPAVAVVPPVMPLILDIKRPTRFVRKDFGDYHYQRALAYSRAGARGHAIQELHFATVLDRQNPDAIALMGRLYLETGVMEKAKKYFDHPLVHKREDVKKSVGEMFGSIKSQQRKKWILYGAAGVGSLSWIPLLIFWRKLRAPKPRVITAEQLEAQLAAEAAEASATAEESTEAAEPAFMKPPAAPAAKPTSVVPPVEETLPLPQFLKPAPAKPVPEPRPVEPPLARPQPAMERPKGGDPRFEKTTEDILRHIKEPVNPPPPVPEPVAAAPEPAKPTPPPSIEELDTEAILRLAAMVEKAMLKGNEYAGEEKFDLARREYRTALALRPTCSEAYLGLGYLCFVQGQWELALEHYVKCLEISPNSADAHYGIGRVLLETDRLNEAVPEFQKTLALDPTFDDARDTLSAMGVMVDPAQIPNRV